jgi:hypothetical protein
VSTGRGVGFGAGFAAAGLGRGLAGAEGAAVPWDADSALEVRSVRVKANAKVTARDPERILLIARASS